jgi:hypothetical protein
VAAVGSISVIGAIARRIAGGPRAGRIGRTTIGLHLGDTDPGSQPPVAQLAADLDALRDEVTGLRREMDEAQNRLDFTERLLGQARERGLLNPPKER